MRFLSLNGSHLCDFVTLQCGSQFELSKKWNAYNFINAFVLAHPRNLLPYTTAYYSLPRISWFGVSFNFTMLRLLRQSINMLQLLGNKGTSCSNSNYWFSLTFVPEEAFSWDSCIRKVKWLRLNNRFVLYPMNNSKFISVCSAAERIHILPDTWRNEIEADGPNLIFSEMMERGSIIFASRFVPSWKFQSTSVRFNCNHSGNWGEVNSCRAMQANPSVQTTFTLFSLLDPLLFSTNPSPLSCFLSVAHHEWLSHHSWNYR